MSKPQLTGEDCLSECNERVPQTVVGFDNEIITSEVSGPALFAYFFLLVRKSRSMQAMKWRWKLITLQYTYGQSTKTKNSPGGGRPPR